MLFGTRAFNSILKKFKKPKSVNPTVLTNRPIICLLVTPSPSGIYFFFFFFFSFLSFCFLLFAFLYDSIVTQVLVVYTFFSFSFLYDSIIREEILIKMFHLKKVKKCQPITTK